MIMANQSAGIPQLQRAQVQRVSITGRKRILRLVAIIVMLIYTIITLFPFYALFIRSFVSTKDSTELHLTIPQADEVNLDVQVGNLSVFYNLDLNSLKQALGIPTTEFLMSRTTLRQIAEKYSIPEQRIRDYFAGYYTFNGWTTLFTGTLNGTTFWGALARTIFITVMSLVFGNLLSIFTGYGLAGLQRRYQRIIYAIYVLQMVIPAMLILLPQYQVFQWIFGLISEYSVQGSTRWMLQLLAILLINIKGTALSAMIFTAAIAAIPQEIEDAAMVDGANRFQYFRQILLPLLRVPIITNSVIMLPLVYNQFLEPYVYLDPANATLLPFIQSAVGQFSTNYQLIYSAIFASVIPLVITYLAFRRFFVEGALSGAIKG